MSMTSRRLWQYVTKKAGDDEVVGEEATGTRLFIDVGAYEASRKGGGESKTGRVYTDRDSSAALRRMVGQATFDGKTIDPDELVNDDENAPGAMNRAKGNPAEDPCEKAAEAAGQTQIYAFTTVEPAVFDPADWVGPQSRQ